MSNITPIHPRHTTTSNAKPPAGLATAIEEQQTRMWQLVSQLKCLQAAVETVGADASDGIDLYAAVGAAIQFAEQIYDSLDAGSVIDRGAAIDAENEHC